jgi:hypothetical protein
MRRIAHSGKCCWLAIPLILALASCGEAQVDQFLPEIDTYYKIKSPVRIWFQAKETNEAGVPVTAEIGPSLDFYVNAPLKFSDVTAFDPDDSKSRFLVLSIGYRYLPTPGDPPTNRMEPLFTLNYPVPRINFLLSDRNRADLDWKGGTFTWRYRNRIQLERTLKWGSYHLSPYASAEFFYESEYQKWADTALYAGCLFPIGKHFELNPYYEHQNTTGKSPNQQFNQAGLMLNMYFARH